MNTDRELLELAAKAAGYPICEGYFQEAKMPNSWWGWVYVDSSGEPPDDSVWTELWNPLTDDGDALRLAVKLRLTIDVMPWGANVRRWNDSLLNSDDAIRHNNDHYAATRRAIVRAAAAIGKEQSE